MSSNVISWFIHLLKRRGISLSIFRSIGIFFIVIFSCRIIGERDHRYQHLDYVKKENLGV